MIPETAADGTARSTAAAINAAIRRMCAGRLIWSAAALDDLHQLRAAYLAAQRAEAELCREDVTEVA